MFPLQAKGSFDAESLYSNFGQNVLNRVYTVYIMIILGSNRDLTVVEVYPEIHESQVIQIFGGTKKTQSYMGVSKNRGTPKSSILIRFSIINHPFWGTPYFWK